MTIVQLPPLQLALTGSAPLQALISGRCSQQIAPEDQTRPYVVWGLVSSVPANTLSCPPEWDDQVCFVDCFAESQPIARQMMQAAVAAVEGIGHIVFGPVDGYESETRLFRWTLNIEIWNDRA